MVLQAFRRKIDEDDLKIVTQVTKLRIADSESDVDGRIMMKSNKDGYHTARTVMTQAA